MQVPHNAVVLVADGRKLLFFRNHGDATHPDLRVEVAEEHPNPANRDQHTDAAGGASSTRSGGGSQSSSSGGSMGEVDVHQQEEDRFAADAAALLKRLALAHKYDKLIVVAPPRTLGELRKHYHKEVSHRLAGELAKDLTGHDVSDIEAALAAA